MGNSSNSLQRSSTVLIPFIFGNQCLCLFTANILKNSELIKGNWVGTSFQKALFAEELEFGLSGFVGTIHCLVS